MLARGNAYNRVGLPPKSMGARNKFTVQDAERPGVGSHAEHGNQDYLLGFTLIRDEPKKLQVSLVPTLPRGNATVITHGKKPLQIYRNRHAPLHDLHGAALDPRVHPAGDR